MPDAMYYRVWSATTGRWVGRDVHLPLDNDPLPYVDDVGAAGHFSNDDAHAIIRDGLARGERLYLAEARGPLAPVTGGDPEVRHEDESPIPLTPAQKAAWAKLEEHSGYISSLICSASNRELAERRLDRRIAAQAEELTRLQRRVMDLEASAGGAAGRLAERIERLEQMAAARAVAEGLQKAESVVLHRLSPREACARNSVQACHCCERLACGDNTSPGGALYRAAKALVDQPGGARATTVPDLIDAIKVVEAMG